MKIDIMFSWLNPNILKSNIGKQRIINKIILIFKLLKIKFNKHKIKVLHIIFKTKMLYSIIPKNLLLKL